MSPDEPITAQPMAMPMGPGEEEEDPNADERTNIKTGGQPEYGANVVYAMPPPPGPKGEGDQVGNGGVQE